MFSNVFKQTPRAEAFQKKLEYQYCLDLVQSDGLLLQHLKEQTPELCMAAVRQNGFALQFVENQGKTYPSPFKVDDVCLEAVKQRPEALKFVDEQTSDMCLIAVMQPGRHIPLKYVKEQTDQICLIAVSNNGVQLEFVKDQTEEMCLAAVKQTSEALKFVKERTHKILLAFVERYPYYFDRITKEEQTRDICRAAYIQLNNKMNRQHVVNQEWLVGL